MKTAMETMNDVWECEILQDKLYEEQRQRVMDQGRREKEKRTLEHKLRVYGADIQYLRDELRRCKKPYRNHLLAMVPMALTVIALILLQRFANISPSFIYPIATMLFMGLAWCAATVWERTRNRKGGNRHDH
jgi:hypothetical protein